MSEAETIELSMDELRELAKYAAKCASKVLPIFERNTPNDLRPREAIEAAIAFSRDGKRSNVLRARGFAAYKAARDTTSPAATEAAQAATQAVGAAYLHPVASARQLKHILGSAAYAVRAVELDSNNDPVSSAETKDWLINQAPLTVTVILGRFPLAPDGGGRIGELIRELDIALRPQAHKSSKV